MTAPPAPPYARMQALSLERGTVVGRHVIDGWLRDGGMASLYRGRHVKSGAKVAIKVQRLGDRDDGVSAARFEREGQVMGRLCGVATVVQVHDVDELPDGRRYLVMEWIEGGDLEETLDELRDADRLMDVERACRLLADVARALVAVHEAEVVHRDLKPANIMIDRSRPDHEVAKLLDFGISADLGAGGQAGELTATGMVLGTSGYAAPEQVVGLPADPGFDVYAFGVVAFEVLTGRRPPPDGMGPQQLPSVAELRPGVPVALAALVSACVQRNPVQRPASARVLVERLEEVRRGLVRAGPGATVRGGAPPLASVIDPVVVSGGSEGQSGRRAAGVRAGWIVAGLLGLAGAGAIAWQGGGAGETGTVAVGPAVGPQGAADDPGEAGGHARAGDHGGTIGSGGETVATGTTTAADAPPVDADAVELPGEMGEGIGEGEGELTETSSGSGADDGATSDDPRRPVAEGPTLEQCERLRRQAAVAGNARNWSSVLRATADARCWAARDQRTDRKALRVEALAELGRFNQCVKEGAGSTDPRVARRTKVCRMRIQEGPG